MPVAFDLIDLQKALKVDPHTRTIMETLQLDPKVVPHFSISGHKLYFKDRLVIPADDTLRGKILFESHDTPGSGHSGYLKTLKRVSKSFYWLNLKQEVKQYELLTLLAKQISSIGTSRSSPTFANSRSDLGRRFHGLHNRSPKI
ncbi:Transposon TF2-1 polyprotein [Quillaja saponaria]|uniref:Transposon TF2-1 polyprotein n=1 Tax=Quillaja saponaria TaxID=32244 RepID=A0AAD7L2P8_QUISA|nr:Transposon TF2-1 polyprotein [Quillaja saponaria]